MKILNKEDLEIFKKIRLECLKNDPAAFRTKYDDEAVKPETYWEQLLSSKKQIFFGLFIYKSDLNSIAFSTKDDEGVWWVAGVYTKPEFRGKGLIIKLMNHIINYFQNVILGNCLSLKVLSTNEVAIHTYKKLGFEKVELLTNQIMGDGKVHNQDLMQLFVNKAML